jgi:hypothetical protein
MVHPEFSNKTIGSSTHRARAHKNVSAAKKPMQDLFVENSGDRRRANVTCCPIHGLKWDNDLQK